MVEGEALLAALIAESEGLWRKFLRLPPLLFKSWGSCDHVFHIYGQENSDLRCELGGEERDRKQARNLSHSTFDLARVVRALFEHGTCRCFHRLGTLSSKFEKKLIQKNTFVQTISSKTADNFIHDSFIPKWFHPLTLSSKTGFIQPLSP